MKQTVTANIGGIVFNIEVDAYEKLNSYLDKIRSYFKNSDDCEEILSDIESRIAEILNPKLGAKNQVIKNVDIDEVIQIMGRPEQYITDEEDEGSTGKSTNTESTKDNRRLFRDTEDRVLGGVASGIGHYVGLDPVWIRLMFIIVFLVGTSGFWIYIILWIVMPEAKTSAQKLQMKGEPVNIENIGKTFEEGARKVNEKIKNMDTKKFGSKLEQAFERIFHVIGVIIKGIFKAIAKILGIFILVIGIVLAFTFFGVMNTDMTWNSMTSHGLFTLESKDFFLTFFSSVQQYKLAKYALIGLIGIPILGMIFGGLKLLFNIKGRSGVGIGFGLLWFISLMVALYISFQIGSDFRSESSATEYKDLQSNFNEYVLELHGNDIPGEEMISTDDNSLLLYFDKSTIYYGMPTLDIEQSHNDSLQLKVVKISRGSSKSKANDNARNITYTIRQEGELLSFDPYISFDKDRRIRAQEVQLTLLVPPGKTIYLDESLDGFIYDIDNITNTWDDDMLGHKWTMTESGLVCQDCPAEL